MKGVAVGVLLAAATCHGWVNVDVNRKIDASNAIVRVTTTVRAENDGAPTDVYEWLLPESNLTAIGKLKANLKDGENFVDVETTHASTKAGNAVYNVHLGRKVAKGDKVLLKLRYSLAGAQRPLPAIVRQDETQKVDFNDNVYFLSPYKTTSQQTKVLLASNQVESYTKDPAPSSHQGSEITFGKYADVAPLAAAPLRFHATNNKMFCLARTLKRVLEVSMWGNLAVEEWYEIEHAGAKLKGTFSRLDYSSRGYGRSAAPSSFTTLTARLPAGAEDIYFRDDIGNISTSRVGRVDLKKGTREVDFTQRFPLFGGWQTRFYFGYNLALKDVMSSHAGIHRLRVPYASPVKDIWVKDMKVEVVLPEGVPSPQVRIGGKKTDAFTIEKRATYLDLNSRGRTVVVLHDHLLVPERTEDLEILFEFGPAEMVWEPLYIVTAFLALFISVIVMSRVVA